MPNIKSAKKRVKTATKAKVLNNMYKSSMRTAIKKIEKALIDTPKEKMTDLLATAHKRIDKAIKKGVIHKNTGARNKARLAKKINTKE
ncbi:MAG: 30S ribosomal protein S20 [Bacilli bacterium]|jgi:small subunit ribosomal protein S20|nr:30S ribosomal protein S20 [Bacilli bacterium]